MQIAIIGGRDRIPTAREISQALEGISVCGVVSGGARGADRAGAAWGRAAGLPVREYLPDYRRYQRRAPLIRNEAIAAAADLCLAFPGPQSRGTWHCVRQFENAGKSVIIK